VGFEGGKGSTVSGGRRARAVSWWDSEKMKIGTLCFFALPLLSGPLAAQACGGTTLVPGDGGTTRDSPLADATPSDAPGDVPVLRDAQDACRGPCGIDASPPKDAPVDAVCEVVEKVGQCFICSDNESLWHCESGVSVPVCPPGTANDVSCKGWDSGSHLPVASCLQACPPDSGGLSGVDFTCGPGKTWSGPDPAPCSSDQDD
jgi:hypothetical protein